MNTKKSVFIYVATLAVLSACKTDNLPLENKESTDNIFAKTKYWYVNEWWSRNAEHDGGSAISKHNTGVWLYRIGDIELVEPGEIPGLRHLESGAGPNDAFGLREHLMYAEKQNNALVQLGINNLPGRDCWAERTFGKLPNSDLGMNAYRDHYIDRLAKVLIEFPHIPIVILLEPDTALYLSNQYTPERCKEMDNANVNGYVNGIRYAINVLAKLDNVNIYMDAGAANKFGWEDDDLPPIKRTRDFSCC